MQRILLKLRELLPYASATRKDEYKLVVDVQSVALGQHQSSFRIALSPNGH